MVKRYTRKNRNLKGGGVVWRVDGSGAWYAEPDGQKNGTAMMMNAIIGILGQAEFKRLYREFGGRVDGGGAPTITASGDDFLTSILPNITAKIREKMEEEEEEGEMAVEQLLEAMTTTTRERGEDSGGTHGSRAGFERELQREFSRAAGREVAGGSVTMKTINAAMAQLKKGKKRQKGQQIDLAEFTRDQHVGDKLQARKAVMETSNCARYVKGEGACNMHGRVLTCPAQQGRPGGFHDQQLRDKYSNFRDAWQRKPRRISNKVWKASLRQQMWDDLTVSEKASAQEMIKESPDPNMKMNPTIWLQAKMGCSDEDRLSRRGWRGNAEEEKAIRNEFYPSRKQTAVAVVGNGSGSGGSSDAYGGKMAGYENEGFLIPNKKYYITKADSDGQRLLTIDDLDGGFQSTVEEKGLSISKWPKPKGTFKGSITYFIPKEYNAALDAEMYNEFLDEMRKTLLGGKKYRKFKKNGWRGGKRKRKTRNRRRTRKHKSKRKTKRPKRPFSKKGRKNKTKRKTRKR